MSDIDKWLAAAAERTASPLAANTLTRLDARIDASVAPAMIAARRDGRRAMLCAGVAAMLGFSATGTAAGVAFARPAPTWVAEPSAESPFSLLVGR